MTPTLNILWSREMFSFKCSCLDLRTFLMSITCFLRMFTLHDVWLMISVLLFAFVTFIVSLTFDIDLLTSEFSWPVTSPYLCWPVLTFDLCWPCTLFFSMWKFYRQYACVVALFCSDVLFDQDCFLSSTSLNLRVWDFWIFTVQVCNLAANTTILNFEFFSTGLQL